MSLDTLSNVKARQGITTSADDSLVELLMESADAFISNYCGRAFEASTFTEYHRGELPTLRLRNYPVLSISDVKVDRLLIFGAETSLPETSYILDSERGLIYHREGPFLPGEASPQAVQATYSTSGDVPSDVKEAYAVLVGHWYRHCKTQITAQHQNVTQQTFGATTAIFAKDQIAGLPLPPDVVRLLSPYRDPIV